MKPEDISSQNRWWTNPAWEKEDKHLKALEKYTYVYHRRGYLPLKAGVIVVYGPRQAGKTTWIKQTISEIAKAAPTAVFYLNAEMVADRFDLHEAIKMAEGLYRPKHIFIDEISAVRDWERTIKALVDGGTLEGKSVMLTGSSSVNIMKKAERLPGRMAAGQYKFRYYPLGFREVAELYGVRAETPKGAVAQLDRLNPLLYRYFLHGGFIRAINDLHASEALGEDIFSIYSAWIDGELAKMKRSPETALAVLDGIANALTNDVSWSSLAKGINHVTVAEYSEMLKDMFATGYLEKSRRAGAAAPKNKKIYFTDPFLYWVTLFKSRKISTARLADLDSTTAGKLAESAAYAALVQYLDKKSGESDFDIRRYVHFEKERSGETDFVVNFGKRSVRLECKFGNIQKEKEGVIYLTKDTLSDNKLPLSVFLMFPEDSLQLLKS